MSTRYLVCADLGEVGDPTAIGILDQWLQAKPLDILPGPNVRRKTVVTSMYDLRHLERVPLGTPYVAGPQEDSISLRLKALMESPKLRAESELLVDATGVGRPVVEMLRASGLSPVPIVISPGREASLDDDGFYHVPKRDVVFALIVFLQQRRLRIGPVPEAETLAREVQNFKMKFTEKGHDKYEAWRSGQHDDLVLAVAIGCWYAKMTGSWEQELPDERDPESAGEGEYDPLRFGLRRRDR